MTDMKSKNAGRAWLIAAAILWGLAGICVKSIDPSWDAMSKIAVRSLFSLFLLFLVKKSGKLKWTKTNVTGAVFSAATGVLYVAAIPMTTAGTAIVLQYIAPILVFLFAVIFGGRKMKLAEVALTLFVFGGIVLSFVDSMDATAVLGNLLALASGFTFALQIIFMNREDADPEDSLIISNIICLAVSLPFFGVKLGTGALSFDARSIVFVLVLAIFQYGLANVAFGFGIGRVDSVEASLILTIEPIFNPIPVALFRIEAMGIKAVIGSAAVILGVTLFSLLPVFEKRRSEKKNKVN